MLKHERDLNYLYRLWIKCENNTSLFSNPLFEHKKEDKVQTVLEHTYGLWLQWYKNISQYSHD